MEGLHPTLCALSASFQGADISWKGTCDFCACHPDDISRSLGSLARGIYTCGLYIFIYFKSCCLKVWPLTSLNLGAEWAPLWDTNGCWQTLNYWERLKISCLNNQRFEKQQSARARLNNKVLSYKRPLKTLRGDCFILCMETNTGNQGKWRNREKCSKQSKIKISKKVLNEKNVSDLPAKGFKVWS